MIPTSVYEERLEKATERVQAIIEYAENNTICRSKQLLAYFGEKTKANCGKCDVCLAQKPQAKSDEWHNALELIKKVLSDKKQHPLSQMLELNIEPTILADVMTYMTSEDIIGCDDEEIYLL